MESSSKLSDLRKKIIGSSLILLITFNLYNILNFLFQFSMARILTVAEYGVLATLFSLIYILGVPTDAIQTIITKYSSIEKNPGKLKSLLNRSLGKSFKFSMLLFIAYLIISIPLAYLLKISYFLLAITGLIIFASFSVSITRGVLQGTKKFNSLGSNMVIEGSFKLLLGIAIVLSLTSLGFSQFRVHGAILGAVLGLFIALIFSFGSLKKIFAAREKILKANGIYSYAKPVFAVTLFILVFFSLDIIIARIVFSAEDAGIYAIASVLAKTIFIGTHPIGLAMFPLTSERSHKKKEKDHFHLFLHALYIILTCIIIALIFLFFFPDILVRIFTGEYIPSSASLLFLIGIAVSFVSVANLILIYKLSLGKTKGYFFMSILILLEILLLLYFSSSLILFSSAFIASSVILLIGSLFILNK